MDSTGGQSRGPEHEEPHTSEIRPDSSLVYTSWREGALTRAEELRALLLWSTPKAEDSRAKSSEAEDRQKEDQVITAAVNRHLDAASSAAKQKGPWRWLTGDRALFERAKSNLDAAEAGLLQVAPAQETATSDRDALRLELQEALGSVRHWQMVCVQATGFIVAGNVILIGYGFTQKQAGMFLLGSVLPVILLALFIITVSAEAGLIVLSLRIEQELHIRKAHSLARTYARSYLRLTGPQLEVIAAQEPQERNLTRKWFIRPLAIILYAASLGQLGIFVLCFALYSYRIF